MAEAGAWDRSYKTPLGGTRGRLWRRRRPSHLHSSRVRQLPAATGYDPEH
jgi:hypothetical protein